MLAFSIIPCSETEKQNLQTAVSEEPTGIHRSKRPRMACSRLCEFSNYTRLDKIKQVVNQANERWNLTMKLCELNSFYSNTKSKKQKMTSKMAYVEVKKWCKCILRVKYRKYRKTELWASLGVQFVSPASRLICKFRSAKNWYKRSIAGRGIVGYFAAESCKPVYWHCK